MISCAFCKQLFTAKNYAQLCDACRAKPTPVEILTRGQIYVPGWVVDTFGKDALEAIMHNQCDVIGLYPDGHAKT